MNHADTYLAEAKEIANQIDSKAIESIAAHLVALRQRSGTLYIAGLGGSAANASHAAADFRLRCGLKCVCLSDSVAELTARANDEGWDECYADALASVHANQDDGLLVFSVGGGTELVSRPLVKVADYARSVGMPILAVVGRDGGHVGAVATAAVIVPTVASDRVTPHTEAFQMVVLHCLASHPWLQQRKTKW